MVSGKPRVSVVIPAHNEESSIGECLKGILGQDYPEVEVIVVNDGSSDRTGEIARSTGVRVVDFGAGHSAAFARNAGAREASGDILYFLDADVLIKDKNFLSKLAEDFSEAEAVSFRVAPEEPKSFIQKCLAVQYPQWPFGGEKKVFSSMPESSTVRGFQAIKRTVFLELGGFNEKIFYFEDRELHSRFYSKGYRVLYDPRLVMHSIDPSSWGEFVRQSRWTGRGVYEYYRQTGVLHVKAMVFWVLYLLSGVSSVLILPLPVFLLMNLLLLGWALKLAWKSGDLLHSLCFVVLHFARTVIAATQFLSLLLFGGVRR